MSTCAVKFAISVCAGVPLSDWLYKLEFRLVWNSNFAWNKLLSNLDMSTCAVKYEILVWAGVPQSQTGVETRVPNLKMSTCAVKYKKNWFGLGYLYLTRLFYCFTVFYVTLRYIMVTYCFTLRCLTVFSSCQPVQLNMKFWRNSGSKFDMLTCAVKYEILVWAGVSLSEPSILLFYSLLCYVTLHCGVLLVYVTVVLRFFVMSTCAVKYEISGRVEEGRLWNSGSKFTCAVKYEILVLNMEFRVGLRYPSLTGFGIRNSVGLKFGFEIWLHNLCS